MRAKKTVSEQLRSVRLSKLLMRLAQWTAALLFLTGIFFFWQKRYSQGWALIAIAVVVAVLLALPMTRTFRLQWKRRHTEAGYGKYAETHELDEAPRMMPEQFELLCLFPLDQRAAHDFDVRRELRLTCRERLVRITELSVPARIRGLEALVDGCLIRMNMPRAPVSRLMITGTSFGDATALTAWYRKNLRLLPTPYGIQKNMQAYSDGLEPDDRTIGQLHRITEKRPRDIVLSLSGRELTMFIRNAEILQPAPLKPGRITQAKLERLGIPELPAILDFAFDTEALRAGADVAFDEEEDRKYAGIRAVQHEADEDFRRPEELA